MTERKDDFRAVECYECGNDSMMPRTIAGELVYECWFCNALEGNASAVNEAYMEREAEKRGMDSEVFPLVQVLEKIPNFKVRKVSGGSVEDRIPPFVYFHIDDRKDGLRQLEQVLQSMEMSQRKTHRVWTVEARFMSAELRFALRPRFMKSIQELEAAEILEAQEDLRLLADRLGRDIELSWWT